MASAFLTNPKRSEGYGLCSHLVCQDWEGSVILKPSEALSSPAIIVLAHRVKCNRVIRHCSGKDSYKGLTCKHNHFFLVCSEELISRVCSSIQFLLFLPNLTSEGAEIKERGRLAWTVMKNHTPFLMLDKVPTLPSLYYTWQSS